MYYVSMIDTERKRTALLAGPFVTHEEALSMVAGAIDAAGKVDPWSHFYSFGTCQTADGFALQGRLNRQLAITSTVEG